MNYQEQLKSKEWQNKRLQILERDKFKCTNCNFERPKNIGLLSTFGIKTIEEFKELGYQISKDYYKKETNIFLIFNTKNSPRMEVVYVFGNYNNEADFNKLKFAKQWINKEDSSPNNYKLICFVEGFDYTYFSDLNVHHCRYILNKMAWEYEDNYLITLCVNCHQKEHIENEIFIYRANGEALNKLSICNKCNGSGFIPKFHYYENGICFECQGEGVGLVGL